MKILKTKALDINKSSAHTDNFIMAKTGSRSRLAFFLGVLFSAVLLNHSDSFAAKDPYEPKAVMPGGRFKGQPIDASRRRPAMILPEEEAAKYGAEPGDIVFANFFSEDRYWIAKVRKDSVAEVILQMEKFKPEGFEPTPHTQFRFKLKPGKEIEIFPQAGTRLPKVPKVSDLVITAWSASIEGHDFSITNVLRGDYIRYVRVLNSDDAFQTGVVRAKHQFPQLELTISDEKKSRLLEEGIRLSDQQGLGKMFNLVTSHCGTFIFCDLMQPVLEEELAGSSRPIFTYSGALKKYLARHDLVDPQTLGELPNWEDEWVDRIPPPKKRVVIFTSSNGGGHNASAEVIKKRILAVDPGVEVIIKDANDFFIGNSGKMRSKLNDAAYQKAPGLWNSFQTWQARNAEEMTNAADQPSFISDKALFDYLKETNPDLVLTSYNGIVQDLARLRQEGYITPENFKIGWLLENFSDENLYLLKAKEVDMVWTPHAELTRSYIEQGIPETQLATTGLPLNPQLFQEFPDASRRKFLKKALVTPDQAINGNDGIWVNGRVQNVNDPNPTLLDPDVRSVFVSSGKAGAGDYKVIVEGLIKKAQERNIPLQIIVGCGTNVKNYTDLTQMQVPDGITLVVSKMIDNDKQIKYTRSVNLIIGKSGSQGPSEFFLSETPRVLVDVVGAQEAVNGQFFKGQGLAEFVPGSQQATVADVAFDLLDSPEKLQAMRAADAEFLKSIHYEEIDRWVMENLSDDALAEQEAVDGEFSTFASWRANLAQIPRTLGLSFNRRFFQNGLAGCDEALLK